MTNKRKAYEKKLDAQLAEWNAQLSLFRAKADKARAEVKGEYHNVIQSVQQKLDGARTKLQQLKAASDEAWEDLKSGAEKAWAEIKTAFDAATSKFK